MKVSDLINVCLDNVKLTVDGEGPVLRRADFLKRYAGSDVSEREVASLNFEVCCEGDIPPPSSTVPLPLGKGGIVCEISTVYEEVEECGN